MPALMLYAPVPRRSNGDASGRSHGALKDITNEEIEKEMFDFVNLFFYLYIREKENI